MKKGEKTPTKVKDFIIETKRNAPELTCAKIADKVNANFNVVIDKSTVSNILVRDRVSANKENMAKVSKPELKIGVEFKEIKTAGYSDRAFGGHPEGDKEVTLEVVLAPSQPTTIDILALNIWGNNYEARIMDMDMLDYTLKLKRITPITITTTQTYNTIFNVPKELAKNTKDARIYAFANIKEFYSDPFPIYFEESK